MRSIKRIEKPKGYDGKYVFFENLSTGRKWKAKLVTSNPNPTNMGVVVTVSPVDEKGKALTEFGNPIVTDSWSHTFNEHEFKEPDFNLEERMLDLIEERITAGESLFEGKKQVNDLIAKWS